MVGIATCGPAGAQLLIHRQTQWEITTKLPVTYNILNLGSDGFLAVVNVREGSELLGKETVRLVKYDTALHEQWQQAYTGTGAVFQYLHYQEARKVHFLHPITTRQLEVITVDLDRGAVVPQRIKTATPLKVSHFAAQNRRFFLGGRHNDQPVVICHEPANQTQKVLPGLHRYRSLL